MRILEAEYKKKYKVDESDYPRLIELFDNCNRVKVSDNIKNIKFMGRYDLDDSDVLKVMHNLTVDDFTAKTRSVNYNYLGNNLLILQPSIAIADKHVMVGTKLYVKLDIDESSGDCIALISFHG